MVRFAPNKKTIISYYYYYLGFDSYILIILLHRKWLDKSGDRNLVIGAEKGGILRGGGEFVWLMPLTARI